MKTSHPVEYREFDHARSEEKKAKLSVASSSTESRQVTLQQFSQLTQPFSQDHPKQQSMTKKLAKMICCDLQPLSVVENEGFRELLRVAEPRYVIPSRKTVTNVIIPKLYEETRKKIISELGSKRMVSLALTTDGWSSCTNQSYLSYTGHFVDEHFRLKEYCLRVAAFDESHTSINLAQSIQSEVFTWLTPEAPDRSSVGGSISQQCSTPSPAPSPIPIYIVTDNAANITSAVKNYTTYTHVPCFAHTIQLCVNDALKQFPQLDTLFNKAKKITTHFRHSSKETTKLNYMETQFGMKHLKLKQECQTRWNSMFHMIQRLLTVKAPLSAVLISETKVANLTPNEWKSAQSIVPVLAKLEHVTTVMGGSKYPTISLVIPVLNELKQSLWRLVVDDTEEEAAELCHALVASIDQRWPNYERSEIFAPSTLLDPRYKDCAFLDADAATSAQNLVVNLAIQLMIVETFQANDTTTSNSSEGTHTTILSVCIYSELECNNE